MFYLLSLNLGYTYIGKPKWQSKRHLLYKLIRTTAIELWIIYKNLAKGMAA